MEQCGVSLGSWGELRYWKPPLIIKRGYSRLVSFEKALGPVFYVFL